jgi:hypothetical protein
MAAIPPSTNFSDLPYELRSMIWTFTVDTQIKHIAENLPDHRLSSGKARRRRQAFLNYQLDSDQSRLRLVVRIFDFFKDSRIFYAEDDFQTFINCLPMSLICREARSHVGSFCRKNILHMAFEYFPMDAASIKEFNEDPGLAPERAKFASSTAETLERFYPEPTSLTVRAAMRSFRSPEHLAQMVNRFFGNKVERLILNFRGNYDDVWRNPFWGSGDDDDDDDYRDDNSSDDSSDGVKNMESPCLYVTISERICCFTNSESL